MIFESNGKSLSLITVIFLIIVVFTSKEILLYNEETLVLICFILFVMFAYKNISDSFVAMFQERSDKIYKDLDYYYGIQEDLLKSLVSYHERQADIHDEVQSISTFSKSEIERIVSSRQAYLEHEIANQLRSKLDSVVLKEQSIMREIQADLSAWLADSVSKEFRTGENASKSREALVKEAISHVGTLESTSV